MIDSIRKLNNKSGNTRIQEAFTTARRVSDLMYRLSRYSSKDIENYTKDIAFLIKDISKIKRRKLSTKNSTIVQFLRSIVQNEYLYRELENLNSLIKSSSNDNDKKLYFQLCRLVKGFKLLTLSYKIKFLLSIKEKRDFTTLRGIYSRWDFYDLMMDRNFKQEYIEKAIKKEDKLFSEIFKKEMDEYMELAECGKSVVDQCFEDKGMSVQAYYEMTIDGRILHTNFANYRGVKLIRISYILQHKKDTQELDIYCNKELEVKICRKNKGRDYEFAKGVYYKMTNTWPVIDEHKKFRQCKMTINVDNNGITQIIKFTVDGEKPSSEEYLELIKQNEKLHIKGQPLLQAVNEFLTLTCIFMT